MIAEFVTRFDAKREELRAQFKACRPDNYAALVRTVVEAIQGEYGSEQSLDPERIHEIDDGDYQGTLLFVIAAQGYQPSTYYAAAVSYGSCSGCDTLQSIGEYSEEPPTDAQANEYLTLALHVVQNLKEVSSVEDD